MMDYVGGVVWCKKDWTEFPNENGLIVLLNWMALETLDSAMDQNHHKLKIAPGILNAFIIHMFYRPEFRLCK